MLQAELSADPDLAGVRRLIHPGDRVLDIGANVGFWTRFLSQWVGESGQIWSFEPIPETFAILSECIRRLDLDNAIPLNLAVSDADDQVEMIIPLDDRGIRNYHLAMIVAKGATDSLTLPTVTLDRWYHQEGSPAVAFIKIDTEQHELPCVRGAMRLIRDRRPALCIEVSSDPSDPESAGAAITRLLEPLGYRVYTWDSEAFVAWQAGQRSINYFFLCSAHLRHSSINSPA